MTCIFATKCWEKDWAKMLAGAYKRKVEACQYPFDADMLIINNGVPDEALEALGGLTILTFRVRRFDNVYADGEMEAIKLAKDWDYLAWTQGDCITQGGDWITPAITVLETEPDVLLVSPASEVNTWNDKDGYDHYCSDQAFVCRVADMNKPEVYQVPGNDLDYPQYALDSFEAMVGRYLKATGKKRKILEGFWVHHPAN